MPGDRWTEVDIDSLREQLDQGLALKEVQIRGRTINAIRSQALRMEMVEMRANRRKWPSRQRRLLRKCKEQGLTPVEIFEFGILGDPHRSFWAIRKQWGRMKLSDRRRARQMRKKKVWKPGEKRKFDAFLNENSKQLTPEEIGKIWGVARSTVARRQTELGVKATREEVMAMKYSLAKQRRARQRIRKNSINMWARRRMNRENDLISKAQDIRDSGRPPDERTCSDCGRTWPKRREFFHTSEKKISIGVSRYFKHRCVLCENERRRTQEKAKKNRAKRKKRRS